MSTETITTGWQDDPTGRHELRYHDGEGWTEHVADGGVQDTDPYDALAGQASGDDAGWPTPPATRPDVSSAASPPSADLGTAWTAGNDAGGASRPASSATWPTASTGPNTGVGGGAPATGGGAAPDWTAVPPTGPGRSTGGGTSRSTGRRVGLVILVLALMAVSAVGGFVAGVAVDVGDAIDEGLSVTGSDRANPDEALPSGVVLSSDAPRFDGTIDGPTSFTVLVMRAGRVTVEVEDADFDTYLTLHDEAGQVVAQDDDSGSAGSLLSRIDVTLEPGTYTVVLDSFAGGVDAGSPVVLSADVGLG